MHSRDELHCESSRFCDDVFMLTRFGFESEKAPPCVRKPSRGIAYSLDLNLPENDPRNLTTNTRLLGLTAKYPIEDYPMAKGIRILGQGSQSTGTSTSTGTRSSSSTGTSASTSAGAGGCGV